MDSEAPRSVADEWDALQEEIRRTHLPCPPRGELPAWELQDFLQRLAEEMRRARWRAGLTQGQVAAMMDTTRSSVSRLEHLSPSVPSLTTLCRYADAIDCRLSIRLVSKRPDLNGPAPWEP